ncbi:hypothetical protein ACHAWC_004437, partial [Mediolabrus comicus]
TKVPTTTDRRNRSSREEALYAQDNNNSGSGALSKKAYNDDALFNYHMMIQKQKIYSAMHTYVNTSSLWNLAWHDSFVRNGLADFVPPLTDSLNVLVVGSRYQGPEEVAVEEYVGEIDGGVKKEEGEQPLSPPPPGATASSSASTTSNSVTDDDNNSSPKDNYSTEEESSISSSSMQQQQSQDSSCSFLAAVFDDNRNNDKDDTDESNTELEFTSYDCIMDRGLMADLCASVDNSNDDYYLQGDNNDHDSSNNTTVDEYKSKKDMARLLYEATKRIRECGVFVTNTAPMSNETKEFLSQLGDYLGLQWEFDLDGISDENVSVSVARKFGSCPTIGWQTMARMIEE